MASIQHTVIKETVRRLIHSLQVQHSDLPFIRRTGDMITNALPLPRGTSVQEIPFPDFTAELIRPQNARKDYILLYLHGGGYVLGSCKTHRAFVAKIVNEAGIRALSIEYRKAPESPFPAALDDAMTAYNWLLTEKNYLPKQILIGGDSAGGGLTLSTLLALKAQGKEQPLAAICLAPWTDLAITGESVWGNKKHDTMLEYFDIPTWAKMYYREYENTHPLISPLYGDLQGLPPMLIQISESEILYDDANRFAWKAHEAGVIVDMQKWKGLIHMWQMFWLYIPEARDAIKEIVKYIQKQIQDKESNGQ